MLAAPAHAGGGCHDPSHTEAAGTTVEMHKACFTPTVLRVDPGATVTFTNRDDFLHVLSGGGFADWTEVGAGGSVQQRYDAPGTYAYMCHLHPGMSGAVVVGDGRGFAAPVAVEPALASAVEPAPEGGSDGVPLALAAAALVVGALAGFVAGRRRVTSGG